MNKEMKKVPTVRFKGFTDDWEQRKLKDIAESYSGGTPSVGQKKYYEGNIPFIRSAEINSDSTELFLSEEGLKNSSAKTVAEGDILYALYGATSGEVGRSRLNGAINQAILAIQPHAEFDSEFIMQWLRKSKQPIISKYLQGGQGNLSGTIVTGLEIDLPTYSEQKRIGEYFQHIDTLITLHQRKLDQLQTLKNYCLQNMFPAKGEKAPAIRLKGFMDDWKQHKLGELLTFRNGFNGNSQQYGSGIPLISVMDILNNNFIFSDLIRSKAALNETEIKRYAVHYGDVLFQRSSETAEDAGTSNVYLDSQNIAVFGGFVICGRKIGDYDPVFLKYLLDSNKIRRQIVIRAQGAQHVNVSQDTLKDISIDLPSMSEQKMIGAHLYNLDNLITLQQRKLDQLQSLKKFMLQNLFI